MFVYNVCREIAGGRILECWNWGYRQKKPCRTKIRQKVFRCCVSWLWHVWHPVPLGCCQRAHGSPRRNDKNPRCIHPVGLPIVWQYFFFFSSCHCILWDYSAGLGKLSLANISCIVGNSRHWRMFSPDARTPVSSACTTGAEYMAVFILLMALSSLPAYFFTALWIKPVLTGSFNTDMKNSCILLTETAQ